MQAILAFKELGLKSRRNLLKLREFLSKIQFLTF